MALDHVTQALFKQEYHYGQKILKKAEAKKWGQLTSRILAAGISAFALLNLTWDALYMTRHTLGALKYAIVHKTKPIAYCSTRRNMLVTVSEFLRHIKGALAGSLVGLCAPKKALKKFLPADQSIVEVRLSPKEASRLYEMAKEMHAIFAKYNIPYCMTSGTQLGATRHGGIMPHDDDVDVFVMEEHTATIASFKDELRAKGIGLSKFAWGYKFCDLPAGAEPLKDGEFSFPFVDICLAKESNGKVTYIDPYYLTNYKSEYLTSEEWNNKNLQKFGDFELYGSSRPKAFCKRMYGKNVFKYGYTAFDHRKGKSVLPRKFYIKTNKDGLCDPVKTMI
jgi:hypothetical protein